MVRKWKSAYAAVGALVTSTFLATACTEATAPNEQGNALGPPATKQGNNAAPDVRAAAVNILDVYTGGIWYSHVEYITENTRLGKRITGLLIDTAPNDARCTRVYSRGRNLLLGYTAWKLNKTVCAGGLSTFQSERYLLYGDRVQVKLCAGTATTGALCKVGRQH
jgi:hypothetical protein